MNPVPKSRWLRGARRVKAGALLFFIAWTTISVTDAVAAQIVGYSTSGSIESVETASGPAVAPSIIADPRNARSHVGGQASFSVVAKGTAPLSYQWFRGIDPIGGAIGDTLFLDNVQAADFASYTVTVTNSVNSATSNAAMLLEDSDEDGLPDSWEMTYFTNLTSAVGTGDNDTDGVTNAEEYVDGTNPALTTSRFFRLTTFGGVKVSPQQARYAPDTTVTLTALVSPAGPFLEWSGDASGSENPLELVINANKSVTAERSILAVDAGWNATATTSNATVWDTALQADGKVIVGGRFSTINGQRKPNIARLNADGTVDQTFDVGFGTTDNTAVTTIALQADGKVIIGGSFTTVDGVARTRVARLNTDGSLDLTFDTTIGPNSTIWGITILSDNRVAIGGEFTFVGSTARNRIAILTATGALDPAFAPGAGCNNTVLTIREISGSNLVIGGYFTQYDSNTVGRIAEVTFTGAFVSGFNSGGVGFNSQVEMLVPVPGDRMLAVGAFTQYNATNVSRAVLLDATGAIDGSFNAGTNINSTVLSASRQTDGDFLLTGDFSQYGATARQRVMRVNSDGTLDGAFATTVAPNSRVWTGLRRLDGSVIIGGDFTLIGTEPHLQLAILDRTTAAVQPTPNLSVAFRSRVADLDLAPDGSLLAGGEFLSANGMVRTRLARFLPSGELDPAFVFAGANSTVSTLARTNDGRIYIGGDFTQIGSTNLGRLARLTATGAIDPAFVPGAGFYGGSVNALSIQPDGSVLVGGSFDGYSGVELPALLRIFPDGTLDGSFNGGLGYVTNSAPTSSTVWDTALQADGRIVVGGDFFYAGGLERTRIARFLADGSVDPTFDPGEGANNVVYAVAPLPNGKILIGGSFTQVSGATRNYIARLLPNGLVDLTFSSQAGGANASIYQVEPLPSGKILIAGDFSTIGGVSARRVALLNEDGTLDPSFSTGVALDDNIYALAAGSDGSVYLGGWIRQMQSQPFAGLVRLVSAPGFDVNVTNAVPGGPAPVGTSIVLTATASSEAGAITALVFEASSDGGGTFETVASASSSGPGTWQGTWTPPLSGSFLLRATAYDVTTSHRSSLAFGPFVVTPVGTPPTAITLAATGIFATKATLHGSANANGLNTTVKFQYGLTDGYGTTVTLGNTATGNSALPFSLPVSSLEAQTTYHFRIVATNAGGTDFGEDLMFVTPLNTSPIAVADGPYVLSGSGAAPLAVLANDSDPDDDALTLTGVTQGAHGTAVVSADTVIYTPAPGFVGTDSFTYTIADTRGGSDTAAVSVNVTFTRPMTLEQRQLVASGVDAPGAGQPGGPPAGAKLTSFGPPALSDFRQVAALVTMNSGKTKLAGIFQQDSAGTGSLPAFQGMIAPESGGGTFKSFLNPLIAPSGAIAFIGKLQGTGVKAGNDEGVWTNAFDPAGTLHLALREGGIVQATGLQAGSVLKSITSISLRDGELLALVQLAGGPGFVTAGNDTVLLRITATGSSAAIREGGWIDSAAANIKTLSVLSPALGSPGHGRWHGDSSAVAKAVLTDKRAVMLELTAAPSQNPLLITGAAATAVDPLTQWSAFSLPAMAGDGSGFAVAATVKAVPNVATAKNDTALLHSPDGQIFTSFAREGFAAPDGGGATFATFFDPVVNGGDVLFMATLAGTGVKGTNKTALWWGAPSALEIVARLGDAAPDAAGQVPVPPAVGPVWNGFSSYALPAGEDAGPVFVAKLSGTGVTATTNMGIWAVDSSGLLRQILRTGAIDFGAGARTLTKFIVLNAVPGAYGATRSFNSAGSVAVQATFSDKSQALLRLDIP